MEAKSNLLSAPNLLKTVAIGAALGAVFGLAGAFFGVEPAVVAIAGGAVTGIVVAVVLGNRNRLG